MHPTTAPHPDQPRNSRSDRHSKDPKGRAGGRRLWQKIAIGIGAFLILVSAGGLIAFKKLSDHYDSMVTKEDILEGIPTVPGGGEGTALNYLILGTDTRDNEGTTDSEEQGNRSDTIMIAHVSKDRRSAFIFSIPRDSYVNIPASGNWKGGENKINSAMSFGGAKLAAKTVYDLTQIPLNGAVIVNFQGVQSMVSAVGGVRVCIPYSVKSSFSTKVWNKGCHNLSPADAEEFVRQRKGTPGGDLGRIKNQQHVIKGLIGKVKESGTLTNPSKLNNLLTIAAKSLTIDKSMNLIDLASEMKDIDQEAIKFATTPVAGTMTTHAGSSVQLDMQAAQELFAAVREDRAEQWLAEHPQPEVASL
ncbi:LCP family protein [Catelliglobosispora koreensis]|uniref:LCP family protein n=1 Tax=Catelliglobosispora koreensis TaxID=129052 RepID=UPI000375B7BA|nr:LCP family protein [Catelliglobosispora koreensis]